MTGHFGLLAGMSASLALVFSGPSWAQDAADVAAKEKAAGGGGRIADVLISKGIPFCVYDNAVYSEHAVIYVDVRVTKGPRVLTGLKCGSDPMNTTPSGVGRRGHWVYCHTNVALGDVINQTDCVSGP